MDGVSSGGVYPAAGVTWALQGTALMSSAARAPPSRRGNVKWRLNTLVLLRNVTDAEFRTRHRDVSGV
jgi:hypothetical protein